MIERPSARVILNDIHSGVGVGQRQVLTEQDRKLIVEGQTDQVIALWRNHIDGTTETRREYDEVIARVRDEIEAYRLRLRM